jgi:16S rRNA (uracil1498-N3)-methyltransferase
VGAAAGAAASGPARADPRLVGSAAHVFVEDLDAPTLQEADAAHLGRALRLRDGEVVTASDGRGGWRVCRYRLPRPAARGGEPRLDPDGPVERVAARAPEIAVCFSLTTAGGADWVVQRLTETGVDRIVPMTSARSAERWRSRNASARAERLRRVAREAAMQSRRTQLPIVADLICFAELVKDPETERLGTLAHPGGEAPSMARPVVLTGPEGGWDDEELSCSLPRVGLGPNVLRAETAAVFAGMLLSGLRYGLVGPLGGARG